MFVQECSLYGGTRHVGRAKSKRRTTLGFGIRRRANTNRMRVAVGFCRRSGVACHAANVGRKLQAITDILRAQGKLNEPF